MVSSNYPLLPGMEIAAAFASSEADPDPDNLKLRIAYGVPANLSASDDVSGEIEWAVSGVDEQEAIWEISRFSIQNVEKNLEGSLITYKQIVCPQHSRPRPWTIGTRPMPPYSSAT